MDPGRSADSGHSGNRVSWPKEEPIKDRAVPWALAALGLGCFLTFFVEGSASTAWPGFALGGAGLLLALAPPGVRLPWIWGALLLLLLVLAALPLLPVGMVPAQVWRTELEALGVDTGRSVSVHRAETIDLLIRMGVGSLLVLYALGHRVSLSAQHRLVLAFTAGVAVYALASMIRHHTGAHGTGASPPTFGFFPNRNHTATLLVMGALCGLGVMVHSCRTKAWIMAAGAVVCMGLILTAVLTYSISRSGPVLLTAAVLGWLTLLGRGYLSRTRRLLLAGLLLTACAVAAWFYNGELARRLTETAKKAGSLMASAPREQVPALKATSSTGDGSEEVLDLRVLIQEDALSLIRHEPWTGIGLGNFRFVFPQYRDVSFNDRICLHPESDWLWLAAEAGGPAAVVLGAATLGLLGFALQQARRRRGLSLSLGCLMAAAVLPVHGLFDVPGHHLNLILSAVGL